MTETRNSSERFGFSSRRRAEYRPHAATRSALTSGKSVRTSVGCASLSHLWWPFPGLPAFIMPFFPGRYLSMTSTRSRLEHLRRQWHFFTHLRVRRGTPLSGYHNRNYVVTLRKPLASIVGVRPGEKGKFRTSLHTVAVAPRAWRDESAVLAAAAAYMRDVPSHLMTHGPVSLHSYADGEPLSASHPIGTDVGEEAMRAIARIFGRLARIPLSPKLRSALLEQPAADGPAFLRQLVTFAEVKVRQANEARYGRLFEQLRIPRNALSRFDTEADQLSARPFGLLHADIHRANLIVIRRTGRLFLIDWELALWGDPLHDLAVHLVRMGYTEAERERMTQLWVEEMKRLGFPERTRGLKPDLQLYIDFEYAQSLYPDTIRAAESMIAVRDPDRLHTAATRVQAALKRAQAPLAMETLPPRDDVVEALRNWYHQHAGPVRRRVRRVDHTA